jgi:hypothetical protein
MRNLFRGLVVLFSSALVFGQSQSSSAQQAANAATGQASERLAADTPKTTVLGNLLTIPADGNESAKLAKRYANSSLGEHVRGFDDI